MKISVFFFCSLTLVQAKKGSKNMLRKQEQRNLGPADILLGALIDVFAPDLADQVQNSILVDMDPIDVGLAGVEDLGNITLDDNATSYCGDGFAEAAIEYELSNLTGLNSIDIKRIELVEDTQDITVPPLALFAAQTANWEATFELEADFDLFNATTAATLETMLCNATFDSSSDGFSIVQRPSVIMTLDITGETDNVYMFRGNSRVTKTEVIDMTIGYESYNTTLGVLDDGVVEVDADENIAVIVEEGLNSGEIKDILMQMVQQQIDAQLPLEI